MRHAWVRPHRGAVAPQQRTSVCELVPLIGDASICADRRPHWMILAPFSCNNWAVGSNSSLGRSHKMTTSTRKMTLDISMTPRCTDKTRGMPGPQASHGCQGCKDAEIPTRQDSPGLCSIASVAPTRRSRLRPRLMHALLRCVVCCCILTFKNLSQLRS